MDERECSAFDLDHTLFINNGSYLFGRFLYSKRILSFCSMTRLVASYSLQRLGALSILQVHRQAIATLFHRMTRPQVAELVEEFYDKSIDQLWYKPALKHWQQAQAKGHKCLILSSSPDFIVEPIAKRLKADDCFSTHYHCNPKGYFYQVKEVVDGEAKRNFLIDRMQRYQIATHQASAYSDSILDLPLLSCVGRPVAVQPDRQLKRHSLQKGWPII